MNLTEFDLKRFGHKQWGALLCLAFVPVLFYTGWSHGGAVLAMFWGVAGAFIYNAFFVVDFPKHDIRRVN